MLRIRSFGVVLVLSVVSVSARSEVNEEKVQYYFQKLSQVPGNYTNEGSVCEYVAQLQLSEEYAAPQYEVVVGISYGDAHRTIGELDVVVFQNCDHEAVAVAEVKCRKDLPRAESYAREQLERFANTVAHPPASLVLHSNSERGKTYKLNQFDELYREMAISQLGGVQHGFDFEIELNWEESRRLREMLLKCQREGRCAKPHL